MGEEQLWNQFDFLLPVFLNIVVVKILILSLDTATVVLLSFFTKMMLLVLLSAGVAKIKNLMFLNCLATMIINSVTSQFIPVITFSQTATFLNEHAKLSVCI